MKQPTCTCASALLGALAVCITASPTLAQISAPSRVRSSATTTSTTAIVKPLADDFARLPQRVINSENRGAPLSGDALATANEQLRVSEMQARSGPGMPIERPGRTFASQRLATSTPMAGTECAESGRIGAPKGNVTPGGLISVRGCDLGRALGGIKMLGAFPGGSVSLEIVEWTPQLVLAKVPEGLRGVADQDVRIQYVASNGVPGNDQPARFAARRETIEVPDALLAVINCAHPQPSQCDYSDLLGSRWAYGDHSGADSQSGRDLWRITIGSAWQVDRIEARSVNAEPVILPHENGRQIVAVDWTSKPSDWSSLYHAQYYMRFFVTGPAGVALTTDID